MVMSLLSQWGSGRGGTAGMVDRPVQGVVGDLLPALLADDEMRAARELLVIGDGRRLAVVLRGQPVDHRGNGVVVLARDEQEGRAIVLAEVHVGGGARVEV